MVIQLIDETLLEDLLMHMSEQIHDIEVLCTWDYYLSINKEDVGFLESFPGLKGYSPRHKMMIYHTALMYIATEALLYMMYDKGIPISPSNMCKIYSHYNHIYDSSLSEALRKTFAGRNCKEIEDYLILSLTSGVNLTYRKSSGTEITPRNIVEFMLDCADYQGVGVLSKSLLEPACGSGKFLSSIIKRVIKECSTKQLEFLVRLLTDRKIIVAFDINPLNVYVSKIVVVLNIIDRFEITHEKEIINLIAGLPFYVGDMLRSDFGDFDYVIGNPPYVRLQNMTLETRDHLKQHYASCTGRFDIYVCFIEAAIKSLNKNGKLCFITSNKYFTANYGLGIRNYMSEHLEVDLLFDLADTKFFEAAVLPAIVLGHKTKKPVNEKVAFCRIQTTGFTDSTDGKQVENIFELAKNLLGKNEMHEGFYTVKNLQGYIPTQLVLSEVALPPKDHRWVFNSYVDSLIKGKIEGISPYVLADVFDICVGVKTTADDIFVKPMTQNYIEKHGFEKELIYPLLQSFNIEKWFINWSSCDKKDRFILYPHEEKGSRMVAVDLSRYPNCSLYLHKNREKLESRTYLSKSNSRAWYECWVPQTLSKFREMKIVTRDIASSSAFALDLEGRHCQGNTFFLTLKESELTNLGFRMDKLKALYYFLGLLNSSVLEYYQKLISGNLYSKKVRYTTTNLSEWPIPNKVLLSEVEQIAGIVGSIIQQGVVTLEQEQKLNAIIYSLYNLNENETNRIELFLRANT